MFTDMVGYTSLSEDDEPLALSHLEEQGRLLRPAFLKHGGREVKTLGDGYLVEFASALEAVRCALDIQSLLRRRNQEADSGNRIILRIGINLGDVEHRDGDIYGDAVNVTSRVQELASPGGVCITQQVYDHIRNSREFETTSLGQAHLKNVQTPVTIYAVEEASRETPVVRDKSLESRRVAALPFSILSSDRQDEYFADGLTEEIINTLSAISGLRVIARTSVMKYKQTTKSVGEIGQELNVGTILEGSVRKAGSNVRVSIQMIDVGNEAPIWAQKYDREMKNIFEIQTDIAEKVAAALEVQLLRENRRLIEKKAPEDMTAYVLYLRGRYYWSKRSKADLEKAILQFQEAVQKDSTYALAYTGLADCYTLMGRHRYLPADDVFPKARIHAEKALKLNDNLAEAHTSLAAILFSYNWEWAGAEKQFRRAIELNPNYATAHYWLSLLLLTTGRLDEAVSEAEKAQSLDPLSPVVGAGVIQAYFFQGRFEEAIDECERYLEMDSSFVVARDFLVHLHVQKGAFGQAETEARRLIATSERQSEAVAHLAYVDAASGKVQEARKALEQITKDPKLDFSNSTIFITVCSILGDQESAFRYAHEALDTGKISFPSIRFSPDLKGFRMDQRFGSLLHDANLE
jgi:adenylate cyclase